MNKFLKYIAILFSSIVGFLYLAFLILPYFVDNFVDLEQYKPQIQKLVKESSKLNLDYSKISFYSTPFLSLGANIEDLKITLDDKSTLFSAKKIKGGVSLPSLFVLCAKTSRIYVENPYINLEIENKKDYKIAKLLEEIINENNAKPAVSNNDEQIQQVDLNNILKRVRIKVPYVKITNLIVKASDLTTGHKVELKSDELFLKYNGARNTALIKTKAKLLSDEKENILADINFSASTPKISLVQGKKEEKDPDEKVKLSFMNIVEIYQKYDLKANISTHLKLRQDKDKTYYGFGYFNVDNLNLKLSDVLLPDSFLHANFIKKDINYNTNLFITKDEKIELVGSIFTGKKPHVKAQINSDKIHFSNLFVLLKGLLDSLNINNDIASIKAKGYFEANAKIKTNFKKLSSEGKIEIKDGEIIHSKINLGLRDIKTLIKLDHNTVMIEDSSLSLNNSKIKAQGKIDNKEGADIKISAQNLSIPTLYNTFASKELKKAYVINSATLGFDLSLKGKLEEIKAILSAKLNSLNFKDTKNTFFITNKETKIDIDLNKNTIKGNIENKGFNFNIPSAKIYSAVDLINVNFNKNDLVINPFLIKLNKNSKFTFEGAIKEFLKNPEINVFLKGYLATSDINQILGKEVSFYVPSKGNIPIKARVLGDLKTQDILAQIYSDNANFISPVTLNLLKNQQSLFQLDTKIHKNKIKIKNSGMFLKPQKGFSDALEDNSKGAKKLVDLSGILEDGHLNIFKIHTTQNLKGNISILPKSSFDFNMKFKSDGDLSDINNLNNNGKIEINSINIPELLFKISNVSLDITPSFLNVDLNKINLNSSEINSKLRASLKNFNPIKVDNLVVSSDFIDVDKALMILPKLEKYMPQAGKQKANQKASAKNKKTTQTNIPLNAQGKLNIKKLTTGKIEVDSIKSNLKIKNNDLILDNLNCHAFEGKISGEVKVNLISQLISLKTQGQNINAAKALEDAANLKDAISGKTNFKTDISLKGATLEEQMKSLKGTVDFKLKDGQYGPFAKLENFFLAENIRENPVFKNTIGIILTPLTTIDSSHFEELEGKIYFKDGIANFSSITSRGNILCLLIKGNMDLLKNTINSSVRVRLASGVSDALGPLALANPVNLIKNTPGLNVVNAKLFTFFTQVVEESEYKEIPDFSKNHSDQNATKFQIILRGDVQKPLKLVKSFKWLAIQKDMDKAKEFSSKYIAEQEQKAKQELINKLQKKYEDNNKIKVGVEKALKMDTTAPEVKNMLVKEILSTALKAKTQDIQSEDKEEASEAQKALSQENSQGNSQGEDVKESAQSS